MEKKGEQFKTESATKTNADTKNLNSSPQGQFEKTLNKDTPEKNQLPDRRNQMSPKMDSSERRLHVNRQGGDKESAATTSTGKVGAGTTNAEEATRLLAERRRQARAQKELEEKKQQKEQEERLREEERRKQLAKEQQLQEAKAQPEVRRNDAMDYHRMKLEQDKRKEEQKHIMIEAEKEKPKIHLKEDTECQRQGRELQTQQEEEERQLRKKRIEEIMKRTRKGEADMKVL